MYPNQPNQTPQGYPPNPGQNPTPPYPPQPAPQSQPTPQPSPWGAQPTPVAPQQAPTQPFWGAQSSQTPQQTQYAPTPNNIAPIDYLNQIATPSRKGLAFSRKQLLILGGGIIAAFVVLAAYIVFTGGSANPTQQAQTVLTKASSLATVTSESQKNVKSRELSTLNSSLNIQLSSAQTSLTSSFVTLNVNAEKLDKDIVAANSNEELLKRLDDARLNAIFDRVYAREMAHEIKSLLIAINTLHQATSDTGVQKELETIYKNLEPLQKQLSEFDGATS